MNIEEDIIRLVESKGKNNKYPEIISEIIEYCSVSLFNSFSKETKIINGIKVEIFELTIPDILLKETNVKDRLIVIVYNSNEKSNSEYIRLAMDDFDDSIVDDKSIKILAYSTNYNINETALAIDLESLIEEYKI